MAQEAISLNKDVHSIKERIDAQHNNIEGASKFASESGNLTPEVVACLAAVRTTVLDLKKDLSGMEEILEDFKPCVVKGVRHAQEIFFFLSYLFLLMGIYAIINSIHVGDLLP